MEQAVRRDTTKMASHGITVISIWLLLIALSYTLIMSFRINSIENGQLNIVNSCFTIFYGMYFISCLASTPSAYREWRQHVVFERRRQAAARGQGETLALTEHVQGGMSYDNALPFIARRRATAGLLWSVSSISLAIDIFVMVVVLVSPRDGSVNMLLLFLQVQAFTVVIFCLTVLPAAMYYERLEVRADGLRVAHFGRVRFIPWSEARLFAALPNETYELASRRTWVRWHTGAPDVIVARWPRDAYDDQMLAVLLLVAARTDLPLMDLRTETYQGGG